MSQFEIVIAGSTGCGKTELALRLAEALSGDIVNADSVQVYKDHPIGSATPSEAQQERAPHHLYGVLDGDKEYDVAQYLKDLKPVLESIHGSKRQPIVVGGSTLYISSWLNGLSDLPPRSEELRASLEKRDSEDLHSELRQLDADTADKLHVNDRQRVVRALEVALLTNSAPSVLKEQRAKEEHKTPVLILLLSWSREELYQRINERTARMIREGLVLETQKLDQRFHGNWQCRKSLGYAQVLEGLQGDDSDSERIMNQIAQATRRYAKRQLTFWKNAPQKHQWPVLPKEGEAGSFSGDPLHSTGPCYKWEFSQLLERIELFRQQPKHRQIYSLYAPALGVF